MDPLDLDTSTGTEPFHQHLCPLELGRNSKNLSFARVVVVMKIREGEDEAADFSWVRSGGENA